MKNRLLAAFLAFTIVPLIATKEPSKVELLTHLKTVKKNIENVIQGFIIGLEEMQKEYAYGKENYFFLLNVMNEIDQQLNHSLRNKLFSKDTLNKSIELIYNDMKTIDDIGNIIIDTDVDLLPLETGSPTENDDKEIALVKSIFTKHHEKYCQENPNGAHIRMQFTQIYHPEVLTETLTPFLINIFMEWYQELLKKIDIKIEKLEKEL